MQLTTYNATLQQMVSQTLIRSHLGFLLISRAATIAESMRKRDKRAAAEGQLGQAATPLLMAAVMVSRIVVRHLPSRMCTTGLKGLGHAPISIVSSREQTGTLWSGSQPAQPGPRAEVSIIPPRCVPRRSLAVPDDAQHITKKKLDMPQFEVEF